LSVSPPTIRPFEVFIMRKGVGSISRLQRVI
jgi:hypothetical protein